MTGEISFVEYIAPVINKLREMEYEFSYESDMLGLIPKVLKNWLKDFVGINIDG
jgi:hypothetical protein